jgi:glutathione S-transferase
MDVALEPFPALADWLERLGERPSIAAESELVAAL